MFLRNAWYVAAWEHEITRALLPMQLLGEKIVFFKKEDGTVAALENACPHRKLPLSMGRLKGDEVECGYHGLSFDCTGACVRTPGNQPPPPGAKVRAYPVRVRYGLLWIWMGEAALANEADIFEVAHWGDAAWGVNRGDGMQVACNYLYITDNLLDPSHVAWVHQSSFAGAACEDTPLEVAPSERGITVSRWMMDVNPAPFYAPFLKFTGRCDRKQQYEVRYPSNAAIRAIFTPAGNGGENKAPHPDEFIMDSYNFMTPIDENVTKYYWFQLRNFAPGEEEVSRRFSQSVRGAFEEDRVVLEAVHKGMANMTTPNIGLRIDAGPARFRREIAARIAAEQPLRAAIPIVRVN
jgi:phenylpropionate dioxygenase-like ring-hydroxylating dioxygenase large terminal subunit